MIKRFTEECEMIEPSCESLEILIHGFVALRPILDLLFDLLDLTSARFSVGFRHEGPDLSRSLSCGQDWLNHSGDCA